MELDTDANPPDDDATTSRWSDPEKVIQRAKDTEKIFRKRHWKAAEAAWCEYQLGTDDDTEEASEAGTGEKIVTPKRYPIFWSSIKTVGPAYYSKTPIPLAPVRYGITDAVARTGSKCVERLGVYSLETMPFDEVMRESTIEYIVADLGVNRVMLEGDPVVEQVPIIHNAKQNPQESAAYLMPDGSPYTGDKVGQGEDGAWYGEVQSWQNLKCYPMSLSYDEVMWTPEAGSEDEIDEMYFRFCYPEQEAYEQFPDIDESSLRAAMKMYSRKSGDDKYRHQAKDSDEIKELYLHGWEIWCKPEKKIRFICPDVKREFLKEVDDTYKLRRFFPCTCPIIGTRQRKTLFGRPGFCYVSPLIDEMHDVSQRIYNVSKAIRRRFVVDKDHEGDLHPLISDADESEYIFISKLMDIVEKGGIQNVIQALPVDDLARSLQELANLFEKYKQEFNEIYGVPDVLRGTSDPIETAKAQEIKNFAATNRFRDQMNQIAEMARDTLELLIDLQLGAYSQQQIFKICGAQYMEPEDQQRLPAAYQMIIDDEDRLIRIDIETDSTSYINESIEQANRNVAIQTVTQGIGALQGLPPPAIAIGFKTIQAALAGLRMGKDFMDDVEQLMQQMIQQAQQPPPPQPDVEMLKVQMKGQENQLKAQEAQVKAMNEKRKLDQADRKQALEAQVKQMEFFQKNQGMQLSKQGLALETWNEQMKRYFDAQQLQLDQMSTQMSGQLEAALIRIREFEAQANAVESAAEEMRLARDSDMAAMQEVREQVAMLQQPVEPAAKEPPVNVTLNIPPRPQVAGIVHDDMTGNAKVVYAEPDLKK